MLWSAVPTASWSAVPSATRPAPSTPTVQAFAQTFGQGVTWINREDDAADRGLRTSKLQYGPTELGSKYHFAPRNELITHVKAIPELKTERLTLTALREEDIPAYNALVLDTERNRWWGYDDVGGLTEPQTERSFYDVAQRDFAARSAVNFAVRLDGQFIGEAVLYRTMLDGLTDGCAPEAIAYWCAWSDRVTLRYREALAELQGA